MFQHCYDGLPNQLPLKFALPGAERQDSVLSGLQQVDAAAALVAVHDSARPLVTPQDALRCFADALEVCAALLAPRLGRGEMLPGVASGGLHCAAVSWS